MNSSDRPAGGENQVIISRRRLPHWIYRDGIYFVTWRLHKAQRELTENERELVAKVIRHFHMTRYHLFCFVVMNDHVHILFQPLSDEGLSKIIHSWKSFTANRLQREFGRRGSVWQDEYHDKLMRNEKGFYRTVRYILHNPIKRWGLADYKWVWFDPIEEHAGTEARATE